MKPYEIRNTEDVRRFIVSISGYDHITFHPDNDFRDYRVPQSGEPIFNMRQALYLNEVLTICFRVCAREASDIYSLADSVQFPQCC